MLFLYEQQLDTLLGYRTGDTFAAGLSTKTKLETLFQWKKRQGISQPTAVLVKKADAPARGVTTPHDLEVALGRDQLEEIVPPHARSRGSIKSQPVDTTGAGDAAAAGMLFGLLSDGDLAQCADLAYVSATAASQRIGARTGLLDLRGLESAYLSTLDRRLTARK